MIIGLDNTTSRNLSNFKALQRNLANYFRDSSNTVPLPIDNALAKERLGVYKDLIRGNIASFVNNNFPLSAEILGKRKWDSLINEFIRSYKIASPFFFDIATEFLLFMNGAIKKPKPLYLLELAHYELLDIALFHADNPPLPNNMQRFSKFNMVPIPNPVMQLCSYQWPVNLVTGKETKLARTTEPTYIVIFRNRELETERLVLNSMSANLLFSIINNKDKDADTLIIENTPEYVALAKKQFRYFYKIRLILGSVVKRSAKKSRQN